MGTKHVHHVLSENMIMNMMMALFRRLIDWLILSPELMRAIEIYTIQVSYNTTDTSIALNRERANSFYKT